MVHKMYTRYRNMWLTFVAKENMQNKYDDAKLVKFFDQIKSKHSPNTLWITYSCINYCFVDLFGMNLKGHLNLKNSSSSKQANMLQRNLLRSAQRRYTKSSYTSKSKISHVELCRVLLLPFCIMAF